MRATTSNSTRRSFCLDFSGSPGARAYPQVRQDVPTTSSSKSVTTASQWEQIIAGPSVNNVYQAGKVAQFSARRRH